MGLIYYIIMYIFMKIINFHLIYLGQNIDLLYKLLNRIFNQIHEIKDRQ